MRNLLLLVKGFMIGFFDIVLGISFDTAFFVFGIYKKTVKLITNFTENITQNIKFILLFLIGFGLSMLVFYKLMSKSFFNYPVPITLFFMGLIIGAIIILFAKIKSESNRKNYSLTICSFLIPIFIVLLGLFFPKGILGPDFTNLSGLGYVGLSIIGLLAAGALFTPGISCYSLLIVLGYYLPLVKSVKQLFKLEKIFPNIIIILFFVIGVIGGIILVVRLIEYLIERYEKKMYFSVLGLISANLVVIPISVYQKFGNIVYTVPQVGIGLILLMLGIGIGYMLGEK